MKIPQVAAELFHMDRRTWRSWQSLSATLRTCLKTDQQPSGTCCNSVSHPRRSEQDTKPFSS